MQCGRVVSWDKGRLQACEISCVGQLAGCTREQPTKAQAFPMPWSTAALAKGLCLAMHSCLVVPSAGK